MAASIVGLEGGYFKALHKVIIETEKALCDMSHIDAHYISCVVTVMTSWQEVVQAAASHMEGVDTTTYLCEAFSVDAHVMPLGELYWYC